MVARVRPTECCAPRRRKPLPERSRERLVSVAKALADANRIEILRLVAAQDGPLCACDVVAQFDLSQPTVSHHLRVLKDAGLISAERKGLWVFYEIDPDATEVLGDLSALIG